LATANLLIAFAPAAPNAVADQFAARTGVDRVLNVLANDKPASANTADNINVTTVAIAVQPTNGTATVNNTNGTITYRAATGSTTGLPASFSYTVNNSATPAKTSTPTTVSMTNFTNAETVTVTRARYTASRTVWDISGTTTWFGANLTNLSATCWLGATLSPTSLIGNSLIDTLGGFQIVPVATAPAGTAGSQVRCQTTSGGLAALLVDAR
jgi:hypothetical protein